VLSGAQLCGLRQGSPSRPPLQGYSAGDESLARLRDLIGSEFELHTAHSIRRPTTCAMNIKKSY